MIFIDGIISVCCLRKGLTLKACTHFVLSCKISVLANLLCIWILFQNPTRKRLKRALFIWTQHNMHIFGIVPFIKLQNDTWTTVKRRKMLKNEMIIVQELCEGRGGCPGLSVLTSLLVSVDVKLYWTMLRHWSQLVPNMSTDIWGHEATLLT